MRGWGLVMLVCWGCAPAHDADTTARLARIEARLGSIEAMLSADRAQRSAGTADGAAASPAEPAASAAPAPVPRVLAESTEPAPTGPLPGAGPAPAGPAAERASLVGAVRLEGAYADAGGAVVVALAPFSGAHRARRPGRFSMEQSKKSFVPHVLAIPVGSTVAFPNHDIFFHNVFSLSPARKFDLGVFDMNKSRDVTFEQPGAVQVLCNLHALMSGWIVVVEEPHFVVADEGGRFTLRDLAPGRYRLRVWSERSRRGAEREIDLKDGANRVSVTVAADAPPQVPPDKNGRPRTPRH